MIIHFHLTESLVNALPEEDYEAIERAQDGDVKLYRLRPVMARFMVDENNQPVPFEQAMKQLGRVSLPQFAEFMKTFASDMKEAAVPKVSGGSSLPPSDPRPASGSESPAG